MFQIRRMTAQDIEPLRQFTDRTIGAGYYTSAEVEEILLKSTLRSTSASPITPGQASMIASSDASTHGSTPASPRVSLPRDSVFTLLLVAPNPTATAHDKAIDRAPHVNAVSGAHEEAIDTSTQDEIVGVRITYPPGNWHQGKGRGLTPSRWPHPLDATAYFQSLFLSDELRGQGWGGRLSSAAIELLRRETQTRGIVTHSWKESPDNSSTRYLLKLGFETIAEYPLYWSEVNYDCTRCLKPPCLCTAQEMYLSLNERIK